jgi:hypothetical protein
LRCLCADGLARYIAAVDEALADPGDPWEAFAGFMRRAVDADSSALTLRLAGTFQPTEELYREAARAQELNERLFERTRDAGVLRPDATVNDMALVLEQLATITLGDRTRSHQLRHRYLTLWLDGLRALGRSSLPGPPPSWQELSGRWEQ